MIWIILIVLIIIILPILISAVSVWYVLVPYPGAKDESALAEDELSIMADDGIRLVAKLDLQPEFTHKWALMVHPYRKDRDFMQPYGDEYFKRGYNILMPDSRAHGKSGGKYIGMGYLDKYDLKKWIEYIISLDDEAKIVIHGESMGASAALMLSGEPDLADNVKVIIADCGYSSAESYLKWKLKNNFHLPSFPLIPLANIGFKVAAGYSISDADAVCAAQESRTPTLFIHGTDDKTVLPQEAYRLYDAAKCVKRLYISEGAGHTESVIKDTKKYWDEVFGFIYDNLE